MLVKKFFGLIGMLFFLCLTSRAQENDFLLYRLKVEYAKSIGLDTLPEILRKVDDYKRNLLLTSMADSYDEELRALRERLGEPAIEETAQVVQIFHRLPQHITKSRLNEEELLFDSIYRQLLLGVSFESLQEKYSEEKDTMLIRRWQMPLEVEERVFGLEEGTFSLPFLSPMGIHIVKLLHRTPAPAPWMEAKQMLEGKRGEVFLNTFQKRLEDMSGLIRNEENIKDLLRRGESDRVLFSLDGKDYTGLDFAPFYASRQTSVGHALEQYVLKTLLEAEQSRWEQADTLSIARQAEYLDQLLVAEATQREVLKPSEEEAALKAYFETHREDFYWPLERFKGIVIQGTSKKVVKRARKLLKKKNFEEWGTQLAALADIRFTQGIFAVGDNAYVDQQVFKVAVADADAQYPYVNVEGKRIKGPETYEAVPREQLVAEVQAYLEKMWEERLKSMK